MGTRDDAATVTAGEPHLLEVRDLEVEFLTRRGRVQAVRGVSFHIDRGETLGLVGESGSGKSVTSKAILGLVDLPGRIAGGQILWRGQDLLGRHGRRLARRVHGKAISIVFQDPMTSLNPVLTIETQLTEVLRRHRGLSRKAASERAIELLDLVGIPFPRQRLRQYPHEFSGGMNQRVIIAMALAAEPELLIADEPTTALDVTIQAQILELLADLQDRLGLAILMITHDLGVVAGLCNRVAVMYAGRICEIGSGLDVFHRPGHPYTEGLLRATPRLDEVRARLLSIEGSPPDLLTPPTGCAYHPRCPLATEECETVVPALAAHHDDRKVACHRAFTHADYGTEPAQHAGA